MLKDMVWLLVIVALLCGGFTHLAAWLFGIFCVGMWQGFWAELLRVAEEQKGRS